MHPTRPPSVTTAAILFAIAGLVGLVYHASEVSASGPIQFELYWVLLLRVVAIAAGLLLLRGIGWARWVTLAWIAYHVMLGAFHSASQAIAHVVVLGVYAFVLFRPAASGYYRPAAPFDA